MFWLIPLAAIMLALIYLVINYRKVRTLSEGDSNMIEIASIIRNGAKMFLRTEFRIIMVVVLILSIALSLFIEKTSGLTFLLGSTMSSLACILGMKSATYANVRTANKAKNTLSIGKTVKVALRGGSISGFAVQAFGLLGLIIIMIINGKTPTGVSSSGFIPVLMCNPYITNLTTYSLGCSLVAMFNRVAGGNYTKAADISADIVAKVRHNMPEDDSRMPNTIADFIGDNVNDIAGNCSDLLESFVATIVASLLIAFSIAKEISAETLLSAIQYPIILASGGLLGCVIGIFYALKHRSSDNPSRELNITTYISAGIAIIAGGVGALLTFGGSELYDSFKIGWASPWISSILGILSGVAIGKITEYYTSVNFKPVKELARISTEGEAFVITKGDAIGSKSCLLPIVVIGLSLLISGKICGIYGIAISALGMLSFVATTVSIDAFGPIADNAGGIAESCHLDHKVRHITDQLDAVGNTTAAIGKGFAIGSAAFATVSLIFAYVSSYSTSQPILNIADFIVIVGAMFGGGLIEFFTALLSNNTIESARLMADEGNRQLEIPGVLEGKVKPDYDRCIRLAAEQSLKKMVVPSILALMIPAVGGILFGVKFVGGVLIGATIVAIARAIFMGNSGGAFDNAKKFVESGQLIGHKKGSAAHKATVVGDTVGDTRKDVVGVALDIFIKMMSTVANTLAPIFSSFHIL